MSDISFLFFKQILLNRIFIFFYIFTLNCLFV